MPGIVHVVDDDPSFRTAIQRLLEKTGYRVLSYASAQQLLDQRPDENAGGCILLDVRMPCMSGPELHAYQLRETAPIKLPYLVFGIILIAFAVAMAVFNLPDMAAEQKSESAGKHGSVWRHRHLVLGALAIFVYVGAEVSIGSFLVNYFSQPYIANLSLQKAAGYVSFYWGGAMVGRFVGSALTWSSRGSGKKSGSPTCCAPYSRNVSTSLMSNGLSF